MRPREKIKNRVQETEIGLQQLAKTAQIYETAIINPTLNLTQNHTLVQKKKTLSSPQNTPYLELSFLNQSMARGHVRMFFCHIDTEKSAP